LKLFGDVMKLFPSNTALSVFYTTIAQKYELRDIFYLDLWPFGPPQMVLIAPNAADQVTVVKTYPLHDEVPRFVSSLLGENSLPATDGEMWKMLHRMIAPGFRPSSLRSMMPITAEQTMEIFLPALTAYALSGEAFSMEKVAAQLIFSIISKVIMGGSLSKQNQSELLHDIDRILDYAQSIAIASGTNPVKKWFKWWRKRQAVQRIDDFLRSFIENRHLAHGDGSFDSSQGLSVLDHMISEMISQRSGKLDTGSVQVLIDK
jgi:cytochrome P450